MEATAAAGQYATTVDVAAALRSSGSARHLVGAGYGDDVDVAAELDRDDVGGGAPRRSLHRLVAMGPRD